MANGNSQNQPGACPECQFGPFERNHYFTGKLMTARDFSDETRYHSERMRHHDARLHGWGVVCGLKVKAHDNPDCQGKYVIIEPGTALDCCGNEILVTEAVTVELAQLPAIADLIKKKDTDPHRLQICISYKECPTEEVPVLYDECGCDDSRCAPNRILSSFEVDAILGADLAAAPIVSPGFTYTAAVNPPHAVAVALHADTKRMYAIASDQNVVYQLDTETPMVVGTANLKAQPVALAVSNKGDRLYVVTEDGNIRKLVVLDTAKLGGTAVNTVNFPTTNQGPIYLAVAPAPDNRLFSLTGKAGELAAWPAVLDKKGSKPKPVVLALGKDLAGLVVSGKTGTAYALDAANNQVVVAAIKSKTKLTTTTPVDLPENTQPSGLGLVASSAPDMLAVISSTQKNLIVVDPDKNKALGSTGLDYAPSALAVSAGGHWAYVLEADGKNSYIQAVDLAGIQQSTRQVTGEAFPVRDNSKDIIVTPSGNHLYVPSEGDPTQAGSGGVGVITVTTTDCKDILWKSLDCCPACDTPNCVVLATIDNYVAGYKVKDQTDPAADPQADQQSGFARIDNREGRKLLPSTEVLTEVVECLLEQGCDCSGGTGTQGPQGNPGVSATAVPEPAGPNCPYGGIKVTDGNGQVSYVCNGKPGTNGMPGAGATAVSEPAGTHCPYGGIKVTDGTGAVTYVCNGAPGTNGTPGTGATVVPEPAGIHCLYGGVKVTDGTGQVTYVCNGKPGADGAAGAAGPGLETDLIQIMALSWKHDQGNQALLQVQRTTVNKDKVPGIVIKFTGPVIVGKPNASTSIPHAINSRHVFQVFKIVRDLATWTIERTQLTGIILPVKCSDDGHGFITDATEVSTDTSDGVAFTFDPKSNILGNLQEDPNNTEVWVHLQGDFVISSDGISKGKAIDAEFVRAEFLTGDRPSGSPYGIQGGQFESWFHVSDSKITG